MGTRYITTPIYYVNDRPHIGHAYTNIVADVIARHWRMQGHTVRFLTGTDEHGEKVAVSAARFERSPQEHTDLVSENFRLLADACRLSHSDFIRTTEMRHKDCVAEFWHLLASKDALYKGKYAGWYAMRDEAYYTETELTKDEEGNPIAPTGARVEWREEESYFFRLSDWQQPLLDFYAKHPDFISPRARFNEVKNFVESGLNDLSVSRLGLQWGIPVPGDDTHSIYVWLDALVNYYSARQGADGHDFFPPSLHVVGKDILRFHSVYWPAFLMAAGLPLPKQIMAHGWWTNEGVKISKSLGNVIDPHELFATYGVDQTRYFCVREVPLGEDGNFRHEAITRRSNIDLANDLGNLVQRVLKQVAKNCDGRIPKQGDELPSDTKLLEMASLARAEEIGKLADAFRLHEVLGEVWKIVRAANQYVDAEAPWALRKTDPMRMESVLYVLCEVIRRIALFLLPFIPDGSGKILDQFAIPEAERTYAALPNMLRSGENILEPQPIFPRIIVDTPT